MLAHLKTALYPILLGVLVAIGIRTGEWLIPPPEQRVVICFANELDQVEVCHTTRELLERAKARAEKRT